MEKKKELSKNTIVILSIIAAFVWTIVIILWLLRNSTNFTNDLGIWVGSTGSIAVFIAVILTTQRQITAQRKNLQEQIDNQNKQMFRPFVVVSQSHYDRTVIGRGQVFLEENHNGKYAINAYILNIGQGIALDVMLVKPQHVEGKTKQKLGSPIFVETSIAHGEAFKITLIFDVQDIRNSRKRILLAYSDVNSNMYISVLEVFCDENYQIKQYFENSKECKDVLEELQLTEDNIKKAYEQLIKG